MRNFFQDFFSGIALGIIETGDDLFGLCFKIAVLV